MLSLFPSCLIFSLLCDAFVVLVLVFLSGFSCATYMVAFLAWPADEDVFLALRALVLHVLVISLFALICFLFLGSLFRVPSWRRCPLQATVSTFTSASFCLLSLFVCFVWFCLVLFSPTVLVPGLFRFGSVYLMTTAEFVAD